MSDLEADAQVRIAIRRVANEFGDLQGLLLEFDRLALAVRTTYGQLGGGGAKKSWAQYHVLGVDGMTGKLKTYARRTDIGHICTELENVINTLDEKGVGHGPDKVSSNSARRVLGEELRKTRSPGRAAKKGQNGRAGK